MILVIGGLRFIGSHTVAVRLEQGQSCVLLRRDPRPLPDGIDLEYHSETRAAS